MPLDAIGQFQTKVAPYDVREGNFQGGAINAILKSGTNSFHGTGFYSYSSDKLTGKETKAGPGVPTGRVDPAQVQDRELRRRAVRPDHQGQVFFMVAGERIRAGTPIVEGTAENNAGTVIPACRAPTLPEPGDGGCDQRPAQSRYGYATGGILNNSDDRDDRLTAVSTPTCRIRSAPR